jgi:histone deacetylase 6
MAAKNTTFDLNMISEEEDQPFAVQPLLFCPHLEEINQPDDNVKIDARAPCVKCADRKENWICLSCYQVYCSRFVNGDMSAHHEATKHPMALSFSDMSVWCYVCDSYVHNELLMKAKELAYESKFNTKQN